MKQHSRDGWGAGIPACFLIFCLLPALLSCGVKAKPTLEEKANPMAISEVKAEGRDGRLTISWQIPVAGLADGPSGWHVYRKRWESGVEMDPATAETLLMTDIKATDLGSQVRVSYTDIKMAVGNQYEYHLLAYRIDPTGEKKFGRGAVLGPFTASFPTETVQGFGLTADEGVVRLNWQSPGKLQIPGGAGETEPETPKSGACLNIYRAEGEEGPYAPAPINEAHIFGLKFDDHKVRPGITYRYKARGGTLKDGILLEGPLSVELTAKVVDSTPPPQPQVMWIKEIEGGVRMRWQPVSDPGLLGYTVERRSELTGPEGYALASNLLTVDEFTDRELKDPGIYFYRVVARDLAGNMARSPEQNISYLIEPELPEAPPATEPAPETDKTPEKTEPVAKPVEPDKKEDKEEEKKPESKTPAPAETEIPSEGQPVDAIPSLVPLVTP